MLFLRQSLFLIFLTTEKQLLVQLAKKGLVNGARFSLEHPLLYINHTKLISFINFGQMATFWLG